MKLKSHCSCSRRSVKYVCPLMTCLTPTGYTILSVGSLGLTLLSTNVARTLLNLKFSCLYSLHFVEYDPIVYLEQMTKIDFPYSPSLHPVEYGSLVELFSYNLNVSRHIPPQYARSTIVLFYLNMFTYIRIHITTHKLKDTFTYKFASIGTHAHFHKLSVSVIRAACMLTNKLTKNPTNTLIITPTLIHTSVKPCP